MSREDELFNKYMLIRQMLETVRHKNTSKAGPFGDTTRGRGRVIALLKQRDGVSTKDMAAVMGIRVSSLNEVLGKMEKEGYVERTPFPDDRRVMLVWLTDKGKAVQLPDQNLPKLLFGSFDQGAQNQLSVYFEQMIGSLQDDLEKEGEAVAEARDKRNEFFSQKTAQPAKAQEHAATQTTQQSQVAQVSAQPSKPAPAPAPQPAAQPASKPAPVIRTMPDGTPIAPPVPPAGL